MAAAKRPRSAKKPALPPDALIAAGKAGRIRVIEPRPPRAARIVARHIPPKR